MATFEWDPRKAESNLAKHGVDFQTAIAVFQDPFALTRLDGIESYEHRWRTMGQVEGVLILVVAHTIRDGEDGEETYRIISARSAEPRERRTYERAKAGQG